MALFVASIQRKLQRAITRNHFQSHYTGSSATGFNTTPGVCTGTGSPTIATKNRYHRTVTMETPTTSEGNSPSHTPKQRHRGNKSSAHDSSGRHSASKGGQSKGATPKKGTPHKPKGTPTKAKLKALVYENPGSEPINDLFKYWTEAEIESGLTDGSVLKVCNQIFEALIFL